MPLEHFYHFKIPLSLSTSPVPVPHFSLVVSAMWTVLIHTFQISIVFLAFWRLIRFTSNLMCARTNVQTSEHRCDAYQISLFNKTRVSIYLLPFTGVSYETWCSRYMSSFKWLSVGVGMMLMMITPKRTQHQFSECISYRWQGNHDYETCWVKSPHIAGSRNAIPMPIKHSQSVLLIRNICSIIFQDFLFFRSLGFFI